jgi:hypothetical protein
MKIPYPADGFHNQQGADAINKVSSQFKPGDTLMGFSLGVQVISLFLAQHTASDGTTTLPPGVRILLAGDTFNRNQVLINTVDSTHPGKGEGIPWNILTPVTMVVNEFDGWSDAPDLTNSPNYNTANQNAVAGTQHLHYYANADLNNPANVVTVRGNITAILVPTQHLPLNMWMRGMGMDNQVDTLDAQQHPLISTAYSRPGSSVAQQAAAAAEQVPQPNPAWAQNPEPAASVS